MALRCDRRGRHRRGDLPVRPAAARCLDAGRTRRHRRRLGLRRLRRGRGLRPRRDGGGLGRAGPGAVRRLRRRRLRGRPDLRRHPRRLRREGQPRDLPRARGDRRRHRGRPSGRPGDGHRAPGPGLAGQAARRTTGGAGVCDPRIRPRRRRRPRRRARAAGVGVERDAHVRPGRRAPGRGDAGLRVGVRAEAADAGLRCDRLRRCRREGRQLPRLPRDRVRRPAGVRDQQPLPGGRRGRRRLARTATSPPRPTRAASTGAPSSRC